MSRNSYLSTPDESIEELLKEEKRDSVDEAALAAKEAKSRKIKAQQELIKKNRDLLAKIIANRQGNMNKTHRTTSQSNTPTILNLQQLIVNQGPDLELACDLACMSKETLAETLLEQRIKQLERMGMAKDKLEVQMDEEGKRITEKLQLKKKQQKKLLLQLVKEDQQKKYMQSLERDKITNAQTYVHQQQQNSERKAMQTFHLNLSELKSRLQMKEDHEKETSRASFLQLNQVHNRRYMDSKRSKSQMTEYKKAQETLRLMDSKFEKIK